MKAHASEYERDVCASEYERCKSICDMRERMRDVCESECGTRVD